MKWALTLVSLLYFGLLPAQEILPDSCHLQVIFSPGRAANQFIPSRALGGAIDGHTQGEVSQILSTENIKAMRSLGFGPVDYRLRTELGAETWHWNPHGTWSEPDKQQGYWVSDNHSVSDIEISNGYDLPRRGNTHDQANDDGYSMIDDGDANTFWKSNPYLDTYYTGDPNAQHTQWVVVDLGKSLPVNAIRISWANPYALSYKVDFAPDIGADYFNPLQPDLWHDFANGVVNNQDGGDKIVRVSDRGTTLRFVRITMWESSGTAAPGSNDIRDKLGFAIKEIEVGRLNANEQFHDYVRHARDNTRQSTIHTSSTDPWHRAIDINRDIEQPGIDKFFQCGLTGPEPALMPLALLYDTPENMTALVAYLKKRKYNVKDFEMGEEPEGQLINPWDYAALYCEWARAVKNIDSSLLLGGPGFASLAGTPDDEYSFTEQKWTAMFLDYLRNHQRLGDFNFFSFEWYPFDNVCAPSAPQLAANPQLLKTALTQLQEKILPPHIPIYITEYGYSSHSGRAEVDVEGALMYADILGQALTLGVNKAFLYGYEPTSLDDYHHCSWGNNMLFAMDTTGKIIYHTAAYYGVNMLLHDWALPGDSMLSIYPAHADVKNKRGQQLVTCYAIRAPSNKWSLAIINKDPQKTWSATVNVFNTDSKNISSINFPVQLFQYSHQQYRWFAHRLRGHPVLELPPFEKTLSAGDPIILPPYSLTVIHEN